jgi:hypothetical protein
MADLRDRAAAVGVEIHELRRGAALANDVQSLVPLKEADRALKRKFGRGDGAMRPNRDRAQRRHESDARRDGSCRKVRKSTLRP